MFFPASCESAEAVLEHTKITASSTDQHVAVGLGPYLEVSDLYRKMQHLKKASFRSMTEVPWQL